MVNSWDDVKNELGLPAAFLIGQEIRPHESTQDSIDMLAYNQDDSCLVVMELKRDKNKLQLLQALSYAAMVSTWDKEALLGSIQQDIGTDRQELRDILSESEIGQDIKIILVAESFDPEVILTADWLSSRYGVEISAFLISLHKIESQIIVLFEQRYPLKEIEDIYQARSRGRSRHESGDTITWESVLPKLKYPFAAEAIELCKKYMPGNPARRRSGHIRSNFKRFHWVSLNFRENYINVYCGVGHEEGTAEIKRLFGDQMQINSWRDGISFYVRTDAEFRKLVAWLEL